MTACKLFASVAIYFCVQSCIVFVSPLIHNKCPLGSRDCPHFFGSYGNVTAQEGETVQFVCRIKNITSHKVTWLKTEPVKLIAFDNRLFRRNRRYKVGQEGESWILSISNVSARDIGGYMCQVNTNPAIAQIAFLNVLERSGSEESSESSESTEKVSTEPHIGLSKGSSEDPKEEVEEGSGSGQGPASADPAHVTTTTTRPTDAPEELKRVTAAKVEMHDKEYILTEDEEGEEQLVKGRSFVKYCTCRRTSSGRKYCSCRKNYIDG